MKGSVLVDREKLLLLCDSYFARLFVYEFEGKIKEEEKEDKIGCMRGGKSGW